MIELNINRNFEAVNLLQSFNLNKKLKIIK